MKDKDLGNILGSLFAGERKEVKLEITCKIVEEGEHQQEVQEAVEVTEQAAGRTKALPDTDVIPRPFIRIDRIDGIVALASYLGCAPSTAQKMKNEGKVPFYERGSRVYFYKDELAKALGQKSRYAHIAGV